MPPTSGARRGTDGEPLKNKAAGRFRAFRRAVILPAEARDSDGARTAFGPGTTEGAHDPSNG